MDIEIITFYKNIRYKKRGAKGKGKSIAKKEKERDVTSLIMCR